MISLLFRAVLRGQRTADGIPAVRNSTDSTVNREKCPKMKMAQKILRHCFA
jgi:hypothetical protein